MSQIKLLHSGGNGVSIVAPDSNPASDRTLKLPSDGDGTILTTNSATGKILQVLQTVKTDTTTTTSTTFENISGLSVDITPSSASSKILVIIDLSLGGPVTNTHCVRIARGSTGIYIGDAVGSRPRASQALSYINGYTYEIQTVHKTFLDSPNTTSATTYNAQWRRGSSGTFWLNRSARDSNNADYDGRSASSITVMEVAA